MIALPAEWDDLPYYRLPNYVMCPKYYLQLRAI